MFSTDSLSKISKVALYVWPKDSFETGTELMEVQASRYRMVQGCQNTLGISGAIGACPRHPLTLNLRRCVVPNCESVACAGLSTMSPLTRGSSVTSFEEEKARSKPQIGSPNGFFPLHWHSPPRRPSQGAALVLHSCLIILGRVSKVCEHFPFQVVLKGFTRDGRAWKPYPILLDYPSQDRRWSQHAGGTCQPLEGTVQVSDWPGCTINVPRSTSPT